VMTACVNMDNKIVEKERDDSMFDNDWDGQGELVDPHGGLSMFQDILYMDHEICDHTLHNHVVGACWQQRWEQWRKPCIGDFISFDSQTMLLIARTIYIIKYLCIFIYIVLAWLCGHLAKWPVCWIKSNKLHRATQMGAALRAAYEPNK
jgi:hypothetical protein